MSLHCGDVLVVEKRLAEVLPFLCHRARCSTTVSVFSLEYELFSNTCTYRRTVFMYSELLGFWALSIVRNSKYYKTQRFGNWICFCPQVRGGRQSVGSLR
jgi:hypothetical protein